MRGKISPSIRAKDVTEIECGRLSQSEASKRLGVDESTIRHWLSKNRSEGTVGYNDGFIQKPTLFVVQIRNQQ